MNVSERESGRRSPLAVPRSLFLLWLNIALTFIDRKSVV